MASHHAFLIATVTLFGILNTFRVAAKVLNQSPAKESSNRCIYKFVVPASQSPMESCVQTEELAEKLERLADDVYELKRMLISPPSSSNLNDGSRLLDCQDVYSAGLRSNGVYDIWPLTAPYPISAYCQFSRGTGWVVFQRRSDGSIDFFRDWIDYKDGFGDLSGEHWLGNDNLHYITQGNGRLYEMRIELTDWGKGKASALYSGVQVGGATQKYELTLGAFMGGTAGDSMLHVSSIAIAHGQSFTCRDLDHDQAPDSNCANDYEGAWWYNNCFKANLNGKYYNANEKHPKWHGILWTSWLGAEYSLKETVMKLRPLEI
ncbi:fibrinogen C domain-containing protein 1-A-like [Saccoglossus kowalevskii]|uniref:Fibrinogen C domain-containing protein 1-A-like n=1 Tax=Saccoglossus kowalevskii TaxID=10224 RepID=A0ABM0MRQ4_SACKO|nr:PREDICTED: fibrinogen C domain-containing protein 1-A-like [Saccoglossus kowalevskii]